jgi:hypothetical protein
LIICTLGEMGDAHSRCLQRSSSCTSYGYLLVCGVSASGPTPASSWVLAAKHCGGPARRQHQHAVQSAKAPRKTRFFQASGQLSHCSLHSPIPASKPSQQQCRSPIHPPPFPLRRPVKESLLPRPHLLLFLRRLVVPSLSRPRSPSGSTSPPPSPSSRSSSPTSCLPPPRRRSRPRS